MKLLTWRTHYFSAGRITLRFGKFGLSLGVVE